MAPIFLRILALLSLVLAIGCSSAAPFYYKATTMNVPNFKEKGNVLLAANLALSGPTSSASIDVQAAYAMTHDFAVQGSFHRGSDTEEPRGGFWSSSEGIKRDFTFGECAVGYFIPLNEHKIFNVFGGYSMGRMENAIPNSGKGCTDFSKWFAQFSLGSKHNVAEFIGSIKFANLEYTNRNQTYTSQSNIDRFNALKTSVPMIETGLLVRAGYDNIKIQVQATTAHPLEKVNPIDYNWLTLSGGICFQFNSKKKVAWKNLFR